MRFPHTLIAALLPVLCHGMPPSSSSSLATGTDELDARGLKLDYKFLEKNKCKVKKCAEAVAKDAADLATCIDAAATGFVNLVADALCIYAASPPRGLFFLSLFFFSFCSTANRQIQSKDDVLTTANGCDGCGGALKKLKNSI